ncbi:MAG: FapA family protein [Spirochaetaceae bacterium]|jgi:uncharacterized protein (DUF342 family)|nr:FapA family protein [Spirochaetaceae bacterium]
MAVIAKGNAELIINQEETEVKLLFTPDPQGLGWDIDAVFKIAREKNLSPLPAPGDLEKFIQRAARSKVPMETTLVMGQPAEPAAPETVAWETLAIPQDIVPFKEAILAKAKPPDIFRTRIERVKRTTLVTKPGKFPFLKAKEEIVEVWDKKEIKEPLQVDGQIRDLRYAGRDKKIGTLALAKPGKPGKNIYGRPIVPPAPADPLFYLGAGIRREKNELWSGCPGFVRIGENWADIVPLAKPDWNITLGSDGITRFLTFYPGDSHFTPPDAEAILDAARKKGAEEEALVNPAEINLAIARSMQTGRELLAFPLFITLEPEARVEVSADLQRAELFLRKGTAGAPPLEMGRISRAIKDSRVQGFNAEELKKAVHSFMEGSALTLRYLLAEGRGATRGADKEVLLLAKPLEAELKTALLARLGKLQTVPDPRQGFPASEAEQFCLVEKGSILAQISRPAQGEQGRDVYGGLIPGLPGNDPELKLFRGLYQRDADIVADISGLLLVKGSGKVFWGTIIDYRDAQITVHITEDDMEASADLTGERGPGRPLAEEGVYRALAEAGVTRGIDKEAVETACKLAVLKGRALQVVARGEAPVAAGGVEINWRIPVRALQNKISVTPGMVLAELHESAQGKKGFTVRGKELAAEDHRDLVWDGTVLAKEDGGLKILTAAQGGELVFDGARVSVVTLKEIKGDVETAAENVRFPGEVRITGKVYPGCSVMGGKDIFIGGSVEGALVSSGGKAVIVQGINGRGKGVVRARTTIDTAFAEAATLLGVEDIRIVGRCISCQVKTNGRVLLTGENGRLAGGICRARRGIRAAELGDEKKGGAEISFGQDYLIQDQIEMAERELEKIRAALIKIEKTIQETPENSPLLGGARTEKVRILKLKEQYSLKIFTLREKFEEHHESEIAVKGIVHPGVVMESHGRYYEITEKRQGVVFWFNKETGRIMEKRLQ